MISFLIIASIFTYVCVAAAMLFTGIVDEDDYCLANFYKWPVLLVKKIKEAQERIKND
jgi:hypothetical protein